MPLEYYGGDDKDQEEYIFINASVEEHPHQVISDETAEDEQEELSPWLVLLHCHVCALNVQGVMHEHKAE